MQRQRKKKVKFLIVWLLILTIVFTLIPNWTVTNAATAKTVYFGATAVTLDYAPGSYFTDNGAACKDHSTSGIHSYTRESACNCKCTYKGIVLGAVQCFGYARYIEQKLFGKNSYTNPASFYHVTGAYVAKGSLTASKLKSIMTSGKVKPGAHLRTNSSGHSMIITQITNTGFSIIQANGSNNDEYSGHYACRIGTHTYTWSSYVSSTYGSRGISYIEMPYNYTLKDFVPCMSGHTWDEGEIIKEATCTENGEKLYTCTVCKETMTKEFEATGHQLVNGICSACGEDMRIDLNDCVIKYSSQVFYTGEEQTPEVTVEYENKQLEKNTDYQLAYKDNKDIGTATLTVIGNNNIYIGSVVKEFVITKGKQTITTSSLGTKTYGDNKVYKLNAKTSGDGVLTYTSSDSSVATVDKKGKVTLVGGGKTDITIKASKTDKYNSASKKIALTVQKAAQTVTVEKTSYHQVYGDKAFTLKATTDKDGAISYASDNKTVATVNSTSGKITLKEYGKAIITVTAKETSRYSEGVKKITVIVNPAKMAMPSVKSSSAGAIKVSWKKDTLATGYQIRYSTKSSLAGGKILQFTGKTLGTKTISKLTKGKKYYVQVRPYKMQGSEKYVGAWSDVVSVITKK